MKAPDLLWLDTVNRFASQSRCHSRQVGAILVDQSGHLFGQGWNGAPIGSDCASCLRCQTKTESGKNLDTALCAHAEANAIAAAARGGRSTLGATLYCNVFPCLECSKLIVGAGIKEVVYDQPYNSPATTEVFQKAGIQLRQFNPNPK